MQTDSKRFRAILRSLIRLPQCRLSPKPLSTYHHLKATTVSPNSSVSSTRSEVPGDRIPSSNNHSTPTSIHLRPDKVTEARRRKCSSRRQWTLQTVEGRPTAVVTLFRSQMAKLHHLARPKCSSVRDHRKQEVQETKSFRPAV